MVGPIKFYGLQHLKDFKSVLDRQWHEAVWLSVQISLLTCQYELIINLATHCAIIDLWAIFVCFTISTRITLSINLLVIELVTKIMSSEIEVPLCSSTAYMVTKILHSTKCMHILFFLFLEFFRSSI